jgi:hypothetical protein
MGERTDPPSVPVTQIAHFYFTGVSRMSNEIKQQLLKHSTTYKEHIVERYLKFIHQCRGINFDGYSEIHHIIPRSFGGTDDKNNLIRLGARYHFVAHLLLSKATASPKMICALHRMAHSSIGNKKYKISSRSYAYLKEEHAKVVSNYSKNTVSAKHMYTEEIKRIPKKLFDYYNGILYEAVSKGRKDSIETRAKKRIAAQRPRGKYIQGLLSRSIAASLYSYQTPKGLCDASRQLCELYPTFTKNTLSVINKDSVISKKFVSIHTEFAPYVGQRFSEMGIIKIKRRSKGG